MLLSAERPNRGSLCLSMTKGHAAALYGLVQAVLPASDWNMCKRTIVVPQELGRSSSFPRQIPGWRYRVTNSRPRRHTRPSRSEYNECNRGTAKRRKRSAAGWAARSRSTLIVLMKPGNWSRRTRWREGKTERGCLVLDPGPGTTSEASYLEPRITVTTQDSSPGMQHLAVWQTHHQRNRML
jgi:hypothetical protein